MTTADVFQPAVKGRVAYFAYSTRDEIESPNKAYLLSYLSLSLSLSLLSRTATTHHL
jgi:hypothetical protein